MIVGIFGGSFNPVHVGHAMLASYISQIGVVDEVWFMVSPQNPLKDQLSTTTFTQRIEMCRMVTNIMPQLQTSEFEAQLKPPYYTINTLRELKRIYPNNSFKLIIGADNFAIFDKWRDSESIIKEFGIIVYPRPGYTLPDNISDSGITLLPEAPVIGISSTQIRKDIANGKNVSFFVIPKVDDYIKQNKLYEVSD